MHIVLVNTSVPQVSLTAKQRAIVNVLLVNASVPKVIVIIHSYYEALVHALEQTHCAQAACDSE